MRKTFVVATREYLAAVKTKSFLVSLIVLPIMMSAGVLFQKLGKKMGDVSTKHVAIVDRTPNEQLVGPLTAAVERYNAKVFDAAGKQTAAKFELERVAPLEQADQQHFELSERIRKGELLGYLEIDASILATQASSTAPATRADSPIHYATNRPTYIDFSQLLSTALPPIVQRLRMEAAGMNYTQLAPLLRVPSVDSQGLATRENGKVTYESKSGQIASFVVPLVLIMLMFIVVMIGASPMTANVIEEKQLRIAEVLLGSVRPGELMMCKLLGGVGVALTLAIIYFGGAYSVAVKQGFGQYIPMHAIAWFVFFTILGVMMYASM